MQHLQSNTTLQGGKYRIERVLGQGGFGITYLAEQLLLQRKVAIKEFFMQEYCNRNDVMVVTNTPVAHDIVERFKKKFISEASTIAKFRHPNIIDIYDVFLENDTAYYVMEYIEGKSLEEVVKQQGPLSEAMAIGYIRQVGAALECMHNQKINHLDVKPNNIMLRSNNKDVVLIDFGISKQYDEDGKELTTTLVGISEGYAPIEQYQKGALKEFCPQTDIYSLGATLYKLVTGNTPPSISDILTNSLFISDSISESVRNAIRSAMKIVKEQRPKSICVFIDSLMLNKCADSEETIIDKESLHSFELKNTYLDFDILRNSIFDNICRKFITHNDSKQVIFVEDISKETNVSLGLILIHLGWLMKEGKFNENWSCYIRLTKTRIDLQLAISSVGKILRVLDSKQAKSLEDISLQSQVSIDATLLSIGWLMNEGELFFDNNLITRLEFMKIYCHGT